jgi:hypothetical protein
MNVDILSVVEMLKVFWSKMFVDFNEAKMVVLEWDKERRGTFESDKTWDYIIENMYEIEMTHQSEDKKITALIKICNRHMMWPLNQFVKNERMAKLISETKDKINYYKNNPEEE